MNWTPPHLAMPQPRPPRRDTRARLVGVVGAALVAGVAIGGVVAFERAAQSAAPWAPLDAAAPPAGGAHANG